MNGADLEHKMLQAHQKQNHVSIIITMVKNYYFEWQFNKDAPVEIDCQVRVDFILPITGNKLTSSTFMEKRDEKRKLNWFPRVNLTFKYYFLAPFPRTCWV